MEIAVKGAQLQEACIIMQDHLLNVLLTLAVTEAMIPVKFTV